MSTENKTQLQTNNTALASLTDRVLAAKEVAAALPDAGSGGSGGIVEAEGNCTYTYEAMFEPGVNAFFFTCQDMPVNIEDCLYFKLSVEYYLNGRSTDSYTVICYNNESLDIISNNSGSANYFIQSVREATGNEVTIGTTYTSIIRAKWKCAYIS